MCRAPSAGEESCVECAVQLGLPRRAAVLEDAPVEAHFEARAQLIERSRGDLEEAAAAFHRAITGVFGAIWGKPPDEGPATEGKLREAA